MKTPTLQNIKLKDITIGKNHRTAFRDEEIQELTESIKQKGVLQSIIVRTIAGKPGYELVSGARRLRSSTLVMQEHPDRAEIPAIIHENLSDADALEIQLTENIQREDVHPMEEAVAFKTLMITKKYLPVEIAKRLGKTNMYVEGRLKLNDLIEPLQGAFFEDRMSLRFALVMCKFDKEQQESIWKKEMKHKSGNIELESYILNRYMGNLKTAPFSLNDTTFKGCPACNVCPKNSAASNLFPDDTKEARCLDIPCFNKKEKQHMIREIEKVKNDPTIIFISTEWRLEKKANDLIKAGFKVAHKNDYNLLERPEPPLMEDFEDRLDEKDFDDRTEMLAAYDKDEAHYIKQLADYNEKVSSGKFIKALVVEGSGEGHYIYVSKSKAMTTGKASTAGKTKNEIDFDITQEINRITEREKRSKELDEEKVYPQIFELLEKKSTTYKAAIASSKELHEVELRGLVMLLFNYGSYQVEREFCKITGYKRECGPSLHTFLAGKKAPALIGYVNALTRLLILKKFQPERHMRVSKDDEAACLSAIATHYNKDGVEQILKAQQEIATKRQGRVNDRIKNLKAQLKDTPTKKDKKASTKK